MQLWCRSTLECIWHSANISQGEFRYISIVRLMWCVFICFYYLSLLFMCIETVSCDNHVSTMTSAICRYQGILKLRQLRCRTPVLTEIGNKSCSVRAMHMKCNFIEVCMHGAWCMACFMSAVGLLDMLLAPMLIICTSLVLSKCMDYIWPLCAPTRMTTTTVFQKLKSCRIMRSTLPSQYFACRMCAMNACEFCGCLPV